jgi:hypothetical protein
MSVLAQAALGVLVGVIAATLVAATIAVATGDAEDLGRVIAGWRRRG